MKYISELQGVDKVGKFFFLPHTQMENPPLSGNFFGVMESFHLMTMTVLKAITRCDNAWQCDKCVFGNFQSVQFITIDIILLIIAILVLNQVHGIKLFMAGVPNRIV